MNNQQLKGIFPVMPTPLLENQKVDFDALPACIDYYLREHNQIQGLTIMGSGGELPYFTDEEQDAIAITTSRIVANRLALIMGVNAYGEHQAIVRCKKIGEHADYVMLLLTGYYQQPFELILASLRNIADASPVPVIYYHFPQVSGQFFSAEQLSAILKLENIVGIKDSALHRKTAHKVLQQVPETAYFSGLSLSLPDLLQHGGSGAICPISAIAPQIAGAFYQSLNNQNLQQADKSLRTLKALLPIANNLNMSVKLQNIALNLLSKAPKPLLKKASSPHAVSKEALRLLGMPIRSTVRAPLRPLAQGDTDKISSVLEESGIRI